MSRCSATSLPAIASKLPLSGLSVYSGSPSGNLYAFNAARGTIRWCNHIALLPRQTPTYPPDSRGGPPHPEGISTPAVVDGVIYVNSDNTYTYAFNASDGSLRWGTQTNASANFPPVVANGVLYVGGYDGAYALNANDGSVRWKASGVGLAAILVAAGILYGSQGNTLYALNTGNGSRRWQFQISVGSLYAAPAVANGVVYLGSSDGDNHLYALNANTGFILWSYQAGPIQSSPVVSNGVVYFADNNFLYALRASDGTLLWRDKADMSAANTPVPGNGVVYLASDSLYAFDAHSGKLLWHRAFGLTSAILPLMVTNAGLFIQVQADDTTLELLNPQDGSALAQMYIGHDHYEPPITSVVLAP